MISNPIVQQSQMKQEGYGKIPEQEEVQETQDLNLNLLEVEHRESEKSI